MRITISILAVMACASAFAGTNPNLPGTVLNPDPAAVYTPRLQAAPAPDPVTVPPVTWVIPLNVAYIQDIRFNASHHIEFTEAIGAVTTDIWQTPIGKPGSGLFFESTGFGGATVSGAMATGAGFGFAWVPSWCQTLRVELDGGLDAVAGEKSGGWGGLVIRGTIPFKI